jgi:alpha-beta hydrolase superfamily lysophospholipase
MIKMLVFGLDIPRANIKKYPVRNFETIKLKSNKEIECWSIKTDSSRGTVILFHGYCDNKSSLIGLSNIFNNLGYSTLLVDFMGAGNSEGNQTTIGYKESEEVKTTYDYLRQQGEKHICLFGASLGAAAVLKAINDYKISPDAIILECPFGTMYEAVCARFKPINIPVFPMAYLLTFWGGVQNGFWAFGFNPADYAKSVKCPTMIIYGGKDILVSRKEIDDIFSNLNCAKQLKIYPNAGHDDYFREYKDQWIEDVGHFINSIHTENNKY